MKKLIALLLLIGILFVPRTIHAQDFSNKGKEFWLAYSYHVGMGGGGGAAPVMTLYLTSDVTTTYKVEIFGGMTLGTGTIVAGDVVTLDVPNSYFIDREGIFSNRAVHVTSEKPIVVYSYITRSAASAATLALPVTVLGKEYVASSFTQISNEANSNSYVTVVAVEDGTTVEITPSAATVNGWPAGTPQVLTLNKGQIYQILGFGSNAPSGSLYSGNDLSGTTVRSISGAGGGCKRIAVFSGSGKIHIRGQATACGGGASDNLYQQLYPVASWGKKYLTVPSKNNPFNFYRIYRSNSSTTVRLNGSIIAPGSFVNNTYTVSLNNQANLIEADQPVSVAQYFTTQGCGGNFDVNDPDMIMLNPVEQNINNVTLVNSNLVAGNSGTQQHHIHVIMRNGGTGLSSFTLDGSRVPASVWNVHPQDPSYSYAYLADVSGGTTLLRGYHKLSSDSGFNAVVYGYGPNESYGYSAGANVKDLYQFASIRNDYATVNFPATCRNSPFLMAMTFPYAPTQIKWLFNGLFADVTVNNPVADSVYTVNGKTLYRFTLPGTYTATNVGTFPVRILALNPTSDGCGGEQEINYDLVVLDRPTADFNFTTDGCATNPVAFQDASNPQGRTVATYSWAFGTAGSSAQQDPSFTFPAPGSYSVKHSVVTDIGCISDTMTKTVALSQPPTANFGITAPYCAGRPLSFSDSSLGSGGSISKWTWNFGDGNPPVELSTGANQVRTYSTPGTYTITLTVETASGCKSTTFSRTITVGPTPVAAFTFGSACLPASALSFTNNSAVAGGGALSYQWNFGVPGGGSTAANPSYLYTSGGPFQVSLLAVSAGGCRDSVTQSVNTVYAKPVATITAPAGVDHFCIGAPVQFSGAGTATGSTVSDWRWDFGDGTLASTENSVKTYTQPGSFRVKFWIRSAAGCESDTAYYTVNIDALPTAAFTVPPVRCSTRDLRITDASTANSGTIQSWTWDLGDGSGPRTGPGPIVHAYAAPGSYPVTLRVTTDRGCTGDHTENIQVSPRPQAGFVVPQNCLSDPFSSFTDTSKVAGSDAISGWQWNFGDGASTPAGNVSTLQNPQHRYTSVGPYDVRLIVASNRGCTDTVIQQVMISGTQPVPVLRLLNNNFCGTDSLRIKDSSWVDVGNVVKLEIFWDAADPASKETILNPVRGSSYSHKYPDFYTPGTKTYTVRLVAYSGNTCAIDVSANAVIKAIPELRFDTLPGVCAQVPPFAISAAGSLNETSVPGTGVYSLNGTPMGGLFNPAAAGAGLHTIRYTFTGDNGCVAFRERNIEVFAVPVVSAGPDRFVLEGGVDSLLGSGTGASPAYLWSPARWLSNPALPRPVTSPLEDITYTLTVTSADGCTASDAVFVKLLKTPQIPNVFTPNGDGTNDRWEIQYLESYPGATVEVFNRYGQLVYRSVNYTRAWDGTSNGKELPVGTYYYIINPGNGRKQLSGFVDIIR
ncbi:MAG: PKD domain-containing protein [Chitinophagaceae bacterium]|nr:MAG: PKD domain-containing protein [Chitinophagaceae bacterium]